LIKPEFEENQLNLKFDVPSRAAETSYMIQNSMNASIHKRDFSNRNSPKAYRSTCHRRAKSYIQKRADQAAIDIEGN
jgi:hypothetical protein